MELWRPRPVGEPAQPICLPGILEEFFLDLEGAIRELQTRAGRVLCREYPGSPIPSVGVRSVEAHRVLAQVQHMVPYDYVQQESR